MIEKTKEELIAEINQLKTRVAVLEDRTLEDVVRERTAELEAAKKDLEAINANLVESEDRFRSVFENSKDAYLLIIDGVFTDCNLAAVDILGYSRQELLERPENISPEFQPNGMRSDVLAAKYIEEAQKVGWARFEWVHIHKNGTLHVMEITLTKIIFGNENVIFTAWHDITDRVKAENKVTKQLKEIKSINKKLEDYSYTISHDLKEPIRSIRAFSEFIKEDYADVFDEEAKDYFNRIIKASNKMALMIDDLLVLSRVGKIDIDFSPVNIDLLIKEVIDTLQMQISENNVTVIFKDMPTIVCQSSWTKAIFQNIISNGIKYNDKTKPEIIITYTELPDYHEFKIVDNGRGIEEDQFKKIFGLFRKAHQDKNTEGSGAGLAIVSSIIEQHNGKVWVDSSKIGVGTSIKFTIKKQKIS